MTSIREMDGDPWEVAAEAGNRTMEHLKRCELLLRDLRWAAQGSWLSQEYHRTGKMPTSAEFDASPLGRRLEQSAAELEAAATSVRVATKAASHDPRSV